MSKKDEAGQQIFRNFKTFLVKFFKYSNYYNGSNDQHSCSM